MVVEAHPTVTELTPPSTRFRPATRPTRKLTPTPTHRSVHAHACPRTMANSNSQSRAEYEADVLFDGDDVEDIGEGERLVGDGNQVM